MSERFECHECEEDDCNLPEEQAAFCENAISCWKSTVREEDGTERYARGCVGSSQHVRLVCNNKLRKGNHQYHVECCKGELCNSGAFPLLHVPEIDQGMSTIKLAIAILVPLTVVACIILAVVLYCRHRNKQCGSSLIETNEGQQIETFRVMEIESEFTEPPKTNSSGLASSYSSPELKVSSAGDSTLKEFLGGHSLTSGSGSGLPLLMQRTLSKQISLVEHLNKGSYGVDLCELWRGIWQGENVTVKIYSSRSEILWSRETDIYMQLLPSKHDNVLGYLGSDTTSAMGHTQLWLITHYHSNGSLRNYLREKRLERKEMLKVCLSLVDGLLYLHTEINGTQGKLSMAHRNLNSKNIFVKNDGTCAIGDFTHAVTQSRLEETDFLKYTSKRYMSPELLERTLYPRYFEGFRQADIYSLGLVLWEICRRCISNDGVALDSAIPYTEWLPNGDQEPTLEEISKLVVVDQQRPKIPEHWHLDQTLSRIGILMQECWHMKAAARLPILRVKKTLLKLASGSSDVHLSLD